MIDLIMMYNVIDKWIIQNDSFDTNNSKSRNSICNGLVAKEPYDLWQVLLPVFSCVSTNLKEAQHP